MTIDKRAPRSGGRVAAQRAVGRTTGQETTVGGGRGARGRSARRTPLEATEGTAALRLDGPVTVPPQAADRPAAPPRLRVAPPAPVSVPRAPFVALVVLVVIAGMFGILLITTKTNQNAFMISQLQTRQAQLDTQQQQLEEQIAGHQSPGSLHAAARKLGLVQGGTPAYIRLPDGKIFGVPKPPDGDPSITSQQGPQQQAPGR